jgi:hypothetical protein
MSKKTGLRVGWFFPSRKEAEKWKNNKFFKYVESKSLEEHLDKHPLSRAIREEEVWTRHRDSFNDLIMKKGTAKYG